MIENELGKLKSLSRIGFALAEYAKAISDGGLFEKSGNRWVMRPNNFVTLEPHYQRALNIAISLRGNPDEFADFPELPLKEGMHGYSECSVTESRQLAAATFYIRRAKEIYERGRSRTQKKQKIIET
ncbi:hypothetical protein [Rhodocaloribacter sp.]